MSQAEECLLFIHRHVNFLNPAEWWGNVDHLRFIILVCTTLNPNQNDLTRIP